MQRLGRYIREVEFNSCGLSRETLAGALFGSVHDRPNAQIAQLSERRGGAISEVGEQTGCEERCVCMHGTDNGSANIRVSTFVVGMWQHIA